MKVSEETGPFGLVPSHAVELTYAFKIAISRVVLRHI
jgi:hypothetical protein